MQPSQPPNCFAFRFLLFLLWLLHGLVSSDADADGSGGGYGDGDGHGALE